MKFLIILTTSCLFACFQAKSIDTNCPPGSLDNVKLSDLLEKASASEECHTEARKVYKQKYQDRTIQAHFYKFATGDHAIEDGNLGSERHYIGFNGFQEAKEFLNNFGDLVEEFTLALYNLNEVESGEFVNLLNDKSSESLKVLELIRYKESALNELKKPFKQVTTLVLSGDANDESSVSESQKLSEFFPKLEKLQLESTKTSVWTFLVSQIPSLVSLKLSKQEIDVESHAADFLKRNAQLEHLTIESKNQGILEKASEFLPKSMTLLWEGEEGFEIYLDEDYPGEVFHLSTVKSLKIITHNLEIVPEKFVFDHLDDFTLEVGKFNDPMKCRPSTFRDDLSSSWVLFIIKNLNSMKSLTLVTQGFEEDSLDLMFESLPKLEAVKFDIETPYPADEIKKIVEENSNVKNIEIVITPF